MGIERTIRAVLMRHTGITEAFKADSFKEKINLGVGAYRQSPSSLLNPYHSDGDF